MNMDQEQWASNLMQEASETIDVARVAFVPTPEGRRTPWLGLIAATVAILLSVSFALGWWSSEDKQADVIPVSDHQIPSVFGYDAPSARKLLEVKGWDVTEVDAASCEPPGRALGTVPQAGAKPSSSEIDLQVSAPADSIDCEPGLGVDQETRALAWRVIDFARTGSPLEFGDDVVVYVNGQRKTMSATEAMQRNKLVMQDLARVISDDANAVRVEGGTWTKPLLTTKIDPGDSMCGGLDLPTGFDGRESLLMYAALPAFNEAPTGQCHFLNVFTTDDGAIDGLVLRTGQVDAPEGPTLPVPDVTGLDLKEARAALQSDGFTIETEERDGCPGTKVLEQEPEAGALAKQGAKIHLSIGREPSSDCHDFGAVDAAVRGLPDFAAGQTDALALGPSIDLLLGGKLLKTIPAADALDPSNWELCATYAQRSCPMSALSTLRQEGPSRVVGAPSGCFGQLGTPPQRLRITRIGLAERTATIESEGDGSCASYWGVQIWVNQAGELIAANLLLGDP